MTPETRNLRPFFFLFVGMIVWWFAPAAFRRAVYDAGVDGMTVNFPDKLLEYIASVTPASEEE